MTEPSKEKRKEEEEEKEEEGEEDAEEKRDWQKTPARRKERKEDGKKGKKGGEKERKKKDGKAEKKESKKKGDAKAGIRSVVGPPPTIAVKAPRVAAETPLQRLDKERINACSGEITDEEEFSDTYWKDKGSRQKWQTGERTVARR